MAWIWLTLAGLLEVVWAIGLKYTEGFTRIGPSAITVAAMIASLYFLGLAVRSLPIGTAYAVWTGIGAVGVAILGIVLFNEPRDLLRIASILLIVAGMIHDKRTRGKVHPAYWVAGAAVLAVQLLTTPLSGTSAWLRVTDWLLAIAP